MGGVRGICLPPPGGVRKEYDYGMPIKFDRSSFTGRWVIHRIVKNETIAHFHNALFCNNILGLSFKWQQKAPATFKHCFFNVTVTWMVDADLEFDDCKWNKKLGFRGSQGIAKMVRLINCSLSDLEVFLDFNSKYTSGDVNFQKCVIEKSIIVHSTGSVTFKIQHSKLMNARMTISTDDWGGRTRGVVLNKITSKNTSLHMTKVPSLNINSSRFESLEASLEGEGESIALIKSCTFEDKKPHENHQKSCIANQTNFFHLKDIEMEVMNSTFTMNCILQRGFLEWKYPYNKEHNKLTLKNTVLDAKNIPITIPLISTPFGAEAIDIVQKVILRCRTQAKHQQIGIGWELQCIDSCNRGNYRSNRKAADISVKKRKIDLRKPRLITKSDKGELCVQCPVGANCEEENPAPLPNYWGYKQKDGNITMMRCPEEYCCSKGDQCTSLTSCAEGRNGTLCGRCRTNTTESLFSPACVSVDQCQTFLVGVFYILAALCYALFLLLFNQIKKVVFQKLKDIWKMLKSKVQRKKFPQKFELVEIWTKELQQSAQKKAELDTGAHGELEKMRKWKSLESLDLRQSQVQGTDSDTGPTDKAAEEEKEEKESGMKYLQILFYFVQDAALFKVHLPNADLDSDQKSTLIRFLEFSPQILLLYVKVTNLCLISTTTAVLKVALKALFGPCIMILLFLLYMGQLLLSSFIQKDSEIWETIKAKLTEAFILTILFSYQKIVQGAFKLVQCVDIYDTKRLFVQADIVCFTWWQTAIEAYLSLAAVPVFIFLAFGPFFIKTKQLSVSVFLVSTFFPLPLLFYLVGLKIREKCGSLKSSKNSKSGASLEAEKLVAEPRKDIQYSSSDEALMETLLKHYRTLDVCGVPMTWLVFLKLYRMALVWGNTYIREPFPRLCFMTILVLLITVIAGLVKPYKDNAANKVTFLSYITSLCIAFINMAKSVLISGVYQPSALVMTVTMYLDICDKVLLSWLPVGAIALWILYSIFNLIRANK